MSEIQSTVSYRDLPGFTGYRIGNDGSVWSRWARNGNRSHLSDSWHQMKPYKNKDGYFRITIRGANGKQAHLVHSLVLIAFVGPRPEGYHGCHNDGVPDNNILSNLRWDTATGNAMDRIRHGTQTYGESNHSAILTASQVTEIRRIHWKLRDGKKRTPNGTLRKLATMFGIAEPTVRSIVTGKSWKHLETA